MGDAREDDKWLGNEKAFGLEDYGVQTAIDQLEAIPQPQLERIVKLYYIVWQYISPHSTKTLHFNSLQKII